MTHAGQPRLRLVLTCLLVLLGTVSPFTVRASEVLTVETRVSPEFPAGITFETTIPVSNVDETTRVAMYYRVAGDATLNEAVVPPRDVVIDASGDIAVSRFIDLQTAFLPAGVTIEFFWEVSYPDGTTLTTASETTSWTDTRFDWTTSASRGITLFTYGMNEDFVSWMLNESQASLDDLIARYDLEDADPISIWVYPNSGDFAGTRQANTRESIAGISYPGSSLIIAIVPDGNRREFDRVIPHEISHQVLYHATRNPFSFPPLWLDEGLATHYQTGGTDHYAAMVWRAAQNDELFDITSLNTSFPFQPAQATLAYAASWSMIDYIETIYGTEGIARIIAAFGDGQTIEEAITTALGLPVDQLNAEWHAWVLDQGNPED